MTSFENDPGIIGRVKFNNPLASIKIVEEDATDGMISAITEREKYLIWLDYECGLTSEILDAVGILSGLLPEGSILIVTANAQLPGLIGSEQRNTEIERYLDLFSPRIPGLVNNDITPNSLKNLYSKALKAEIEQGALARSNEEFVQLFNYHYSDGAPMLTFGGIIKSKDVTFTRAVSGLKYVNQAELPTEISVPALTHKEKIWLDSVGSASAKTAKTGLNHTDIAKYFEFASHYPTYYEISI